MNVSEMNNLLMSSAKSLSKSGYDLGMDSKMFVHNGQKLISALLNYQKITEIERKLIITYCLYEKVQYSYILMMLFKQDRSMCMQFLSYVEDLSAKNEITINPQLRKAMTIVEK